MSAPVRVDRGEGQAMPAGFKHNVDLLLEQPDRDAFAARFPEFMFAFDDPGLRALFEPADREASKAKRRSRVMGLSAVVLVTTCLIAGALSRVFLDESWFRPVIMIAAAGAVIGLLLGWAGILTASSRDEWLRQRYLCERIRQLHFQTLSRWAALIIDCARRNDPAGFLALRLARTEKFRSQVVNPSAVKLTDLLADRSEESVWLVDPDETPLADDAISARYFEALEELRLRHQLNFTGLQLLAFWAFPPRSPLQTARLLTGTGAFSAFLLLILGVLGLVLDAATGRFAAFTHTAIVCLALVILAVRTLEEGLQVHGDVGRYRVYDAALRRSNDQYRAAGSNAGRQAILLELEETCFDEMVGFLRSHHEARILM